MVIVHFLQLSEMTGWIIAGSLSFSAVAAATAILFEMRHAVDLENDMGAADFEDFTLPPGWKKPRKSRVIQPRIGTLHMPH
ncbi:MAG: hypothetical protein EOP85_17650 [Verrucomicrobiaceae bacterium]|nr:MAG: hypothetical protein EOP85_17650 [Verrucomicrobiaceae bacterium]